MNKKLLAVAIAASFVAPAVMADTTVYGRINTAVINTDSDDGWYDGWDVESNASRFGVKGSEDLGNGMKAVFQYEWGVDASDSGEFSGRLAYVGLAGGFGTVAVGRQWTPYYGTVNKTDIMQMVSVNDHYIGPARVGNALAYVSPNFNGFSAKLAMIIDDADNDPQGWDQDGVDAYNLSLDYNNGPLSVGFSYLSGDEQDNACGEFNDITLWGLGAKYNFGNFALIAQYEDYENDDDWNPADIEVEAWGLGAEAYFGNNTIRAVYGEVEVNGYDMDNWALGFEHKFSKRTRVYAEYQDTEIGDHNSAAGEEGSRFGVGIRHDF